MSGPYKIEIIGDFWWLTGPTIEPGNNEYRVSERDRENMTCRCEELNAAWADGKAVGQESIVKVVDDVPVITCDSHQDPDITEEDVIEVQGWNSCLHVVKAAIARAKKE